MNKFRTGVAGTYLSLCLILGGGSGAAANGLLQLLAVAILSIHVWSRGAPPLAAEGRRLALLFLAFASVAAAQLIPLPPALWTALPGREVVVRSLAMLGVAPSTMPATLDPQRTTASLLWLLPPAAIFLIATRLTRDERVAVVKILLVIAVVSIALGAFQLFGGPSSPLYFYEITNANRSVGFFANANHVATLMLCSLPFTAASMARASKGRGGSGKREGRGFIYFAIAAFIAIGIAINGSLAAYAILIPTAVASFLLHRRARDKKLSTGHWLAVGGAAILFVGFSALGPLAGDRLAAKLGEADGIGRKISIPVTIEAAKDHLPWGSGLGTFRDIYRTYEPSEDVTSVYVNHAHNDYAEVALEMGWPGLFLVVLFLAWWATRTIAVWRTDFNGAGLARAASIAIGVVLLHSLVDYPLRTSAIAALMALAAGFMLQPPASRSNRGGSERRGSKNQSARHIDAGAV